MKPFSDPVWWRRAAALLAVYVLAGKLGLMLAFVNASATAVWPPTGIALAALLLFGVELWPAVFAGAFIVNITTAGSLVSSAGIAAGNTLEAVIGAALATRFANGRFAVSRAQHVFALALVMVAVAAPLSATIGVTSLALTGNALWRDYGSIWITWWLGDAVAACLLTPLLLAWWDGPGVEWTRARVGEAMLLVATLVLVTGLVFGGFGTDSRLPLEFLCIPVLLWSAFRFGSRETTTVAVLMSLLAMLGTLSDRGPFARASHNEALVLLQTFMGVAAIMAAAVAALVAEQRATEARAQRFNRDLESRVAERTVQLANSEARLIDAQRVAHIGSWEWDIAADRLWWSAELRRIYGVADADAVPSYEAFIGRVHPDDRRLVEETVARARTDGRRFQFEHRIVRPDGTVAIMDAHGQVVADQSGRAVRMMGTGQDVTEWKQLEAERAQLVRDQAAGREAEEANRLKDSFLATLSHELRTPLNAIVGWLQILRQRELDPAIRRAVVVLERNATTLRRLIEDMLDMSAILSGKLQIRREPLDLRVVVEDVVDSLRPVAEAKNIALRLRSSPRPAACDGDLHRLRQVAGNLLSNALKFTAAGGRIDADVFQEADTVVLRIRDTGTGISEASLPFIFDAFRQADASMTRSHGGLGLGLAIVREIVERHGGTVRAESGDGATFTVVLPAAVMPAGRAEARLPQPAGRFQFAGVRVLAVDDDQDSRDLLSVLFEAAGARFVGVESAREGLLECERGAPGLLLVDLAMPEQDGFSFVASLRDRGIDAPVIAITAHADARNRERALAGGFNAYVPKPVVIDDLMQTAATVLGLVIE